MVCVKVLEQLVVVYFKVSWFLFKVRNSFLTKPWLLFQGRAFCCFKFSLVCGRGDRRAKTFFPCLALPCPALPCPALPCSISIETTKVTTNINEI